MHNAHMYYLLMPGLEERTRFMAQMRDLNVACVFHYIPLHSSPMGKKCGRASGDMSNTTDLSQRLVRLPLWVELDEFQPTVIRHILSVLD